MFETRPAARKFTGLLFALLLGVPGAGSLYAASYPVAFCGPASLSGTFSESMQVTPWLPRASVGIMSPDQGSFETWEGGNHDVVNDITEDSMKFFEGLNFSSPALKCIQAARGASYALNWTFDAEMDGSLGDYDSPRCGGGDALIRLNLQLVLAQIEELAQGRKADGPEISTPPHELFHAVQAGYKAFSRCPDEWSWEGMAEAIAYVWLQDYDSRRGCNINVDNREYRYFSDPLNKPRNSRQAYGTSFFWEYLGREGNYLVEYEKVRIPLSGKVTGKPGGCRPKRPFDTYLIEKFLNMPQSRLDQLDSSVSEREHWDLKWLDELLADELNKALRNYAPELATLKGGLYVVYPKFISWLADAITTEDVATAQSEARSDTHLGVFFENGCRKVTLRRGASASPADPIDIRQNASVCLKVRFDPSSDYFFIWTDHDLAASQLHLGFQGNDHARLSPEAGSSETRWLVNARSGKQHMYLVLSNMAPVAADTSDIAGLELNLDFMSAGPD